MYLLFLLSTIMSLVMGYISIFNANVKGPVPPIILAIVLFVIALVCLIRAPKLCLNKTNKVMHME